MRDWDRIQLKKCFVKMEADYMVRLGDFVIIVFVLEVDFVALNARIGIRIDCC